MPARFSDSWNAPSAVAPSPKETDHDLAAAALLDGETDAGGDGQAAADDAVGANDALAEISNVHGAALALAVARRAAKEFGEHIPDVAPLGNDVAVAAVGAGDVIRRLQCGARAHRHSLLSLGKVQETVQLAGLEELLGSVFETSNQSHAPVHRQELFARQVLGWCIPGLVSHDSSSPNGRALQCQLSTIIIIAEWQRNCQPFSR